MSLGFALDMTMRGLMSTTNRLQLVSQNITNARKAGYTRKEGSDVYVTTNSGTVPVKTNVVGSTDRYLTQQVVGDVGEMGKNKAISEILEYYSSQLGTTDGKSTLSTYVNDLYGSLQQISVNPDTLSNKTNAVQDAANISDALRNLSGDIQELRGQADQKIKDIVASINAALEKIGSINSKIIPGQTADAQMAEFEDQRMAALESLGEMIDIQYYFTSQNQVQIFTTSGQPLLLSDVKQISYIPTTPVNSASTFQPILLNGVDISGSLNGGSLAGNLEVRDKILVEEQAKLDEFSNVLKDQMNALLNKGSSLPPQTSMTGTLRGLTAATPLSATGSLRVAIVNTAGVLQNYTDVNLSTITTVGGLLTALNAIPNVSASLDANGSLKIDSTLSGSGISLNEMNSAVGPDNKGASLYFGMQDLFVGTNASNTDISDYLEKSPTSISTGYLNSGALTVGQTVITRGDGTLSLAMSQILKTNVSFGAAGNFTAQTNTLSAYIESIMADGATKAKIAEDAYDASNTLYSTTKDTLNNKSGVNIDEETTKMLALQNAYESSARMISAIRDMFQALLNAVA